MISLSTNFLLVKNYKLYKQTPNKYTKPRVYIVHIIQFAISKSLKFRKTNWNYI